MKNIKYLLLFLLLPAFVFVSCVDTDDTEVLMKKDNYRDLADAQKTVEGIYGKVMELAKQVVVLNELRADLMDVTINADAELQDISYLKSDADNEWVDPVPFYSVIQSCNDALANFNEMKDNNLFTEDEYDEFYSEAMTVRCWTYLQLGILFGRVPYITTTFDSPNSLGIDDSKYIDLDNLIPALVDSMESIPYMKQFSDLSEMEDAYLNGHALRYYYINKRAFMTELYLWNGEYLKAAESFRTMHNEYDEDHWRVMKATTGVYQGSFLGAFMVTYERYMWNDVNSLVNLWTNMFSQEMEETYTNYEVLTCMSYDKSYGAKYPFVPLMGVQGEGRYLLKPSQNAIKNFWGDQEQNNGFHFDGRGEGGSYDYDDQNRPYITKYVMEYDPVKPYEMSGKWILYRAGQLNLLYAEACNRFSEMGGTINGKPVSKIRTLADAFLNKGISGEYAFKDTLIAVDGSDSLVAYPDDSVSVAGWGPGVAFPYPFNFDARYSTVPYHRGTWRDHAGIRQRASLKPVEYDSATVVDKYNTTMDNLSEMHFYERAILDEFGLETAYEGHRWADILRIARRWNKDIPGSGTKLLNETLKKKFDANGQSFTPFTDDESKWFLPVKFN